MNEELTKAVHAVAEELKAEFEDGMQWEDLFEVIPRLVNLAKALRITLRLDESHQKAVLIELIDYLVDTTDGWGPDGVIDPVIKAAARAFL